MTSNRAKGSSEAVPVSLRFYRAVSPSIEPLSVSSSAKTAGRCHRAGDPSPLYGSLDERTPFRELQRHSDANLEGARLRLARLTFTGLLYDGTTGEGQARGGADPKALVGDDYRSAQLLMDFAERADADALLLPSAAWPGASSLVVSHVAVPTCVSLDSEEILLFEEGCPEAVAQGGAMLGTRAMLRLVAGLFTGRARQSPRS